MRFKVGEMAILAISRNGTYAGHEVLIIEVGPFPFGMFTSESGDPVEADYDCRIDCGELGCYMDWQLRKKNPPVEPESLTRSEEIENV